MQYSNPLILGLFLLLFFSPYPGLAQQEIPHFDDITQQTVMLNSIDLDQDDQPEASPNIQAPEEIPPPSTPLPPQTIITPENIVVTTQEEKLADVAIPMQKVGARYVIKVGASLPLRGEASLIGNQIVDGMSIFFNKVQKEQNKTSFVFNLDVMNDDGDIKKMRTNLKILQKKSPLFLNLWGPDAATDILKNPGNSPIFSLFALEGSADHRSKKNQNFIYLRPTYEQQIDALINYSVNTLNRNKIAIFYEASEIGEDALAALKRVLKKYNLSLAAEASYQQGTLNVSKAVEDIATKSPNAILCFGYPRPTYNFVRQIINKGLYKTVILGVDTLTLIQKPLKRSRGIKIITSSVVPDPQKSKLKIVEQYRADMAKYAPNKTLSVFSLEAYINAALLVECTKLVQFPLTTQKLMQKIENIKNVRFKGLDMNFDPEQRTLSKQIWLDPGEDQEWLIVNESGEITQPGAQSPQEKISSSPPAEDSSL